MKGKFITLEGIEGAGKSTAIVILNKLLNQKNISFINTREPGGGPNGKKIRDLLLDSKNNINSSTELLLMFADRADHVESLIIPNLQAGIWVISDRYVDSSIAYQGGGRGLNQNMIDNLAKSMSFPVPDLTLLFDLSVDIALERATNRSELDRFEVEDYDFHQRIRSTYLDLAINNKARIKIIDSSKDKKKVQELCSNELLKFLSDEGYN